jgi:hypothetical protein
MIRNDPSLCVHTTLVVVRTLGNFLSCYHGLADLFFWFLGYHNVTAPEVALSMPAPPL